MMQQQDLRELSEFSSQEAPVLSLYLNLGRHGRSMEEHKLLLRKLLTEGVEQGAAAADVERIERFFEHEYDRQGKSVVCFSCQAPKFWRSYALLVPVQNAVFVGRRPLVKPLMDQMSIGRHLHEIDVKRGMPGVYVPDALDKKYPNIGCEWGWFWVFPAKNYSVDPETKIRRRHYQHESELQRAIRSASIRAGITKRVSPHTFRHCYATHLLLAGYDIRTVAELMGHKDVKTTMIYLHILQPGGKGVESPLDNLELSQWNIISR